MLCSLRAIIGDLALSPPPLPPLSIAQACRPAVSRVFASKRKQLALDLGEANTVTAG